PPGVGGELTEVGDVLVARNREHAFAHVVLAHEGEGRLGLQLPALEREHVELAVAQLARVGEHALHVLAGAGRGRAAVVELGKLQLGGERGAEAGVVGPGRAAAVDLVGVGRWRQAAKGSGKGESQGDGLGGRHEWVLLRRMRRIWAAQYGVALTQNGGANGRERITNLSCAGAWPPECEGRGVRSVTSWARPGWPTF